MICSIITVLKNTFYILYLCTVYSSGEQFEKL